MTTTQPSRHVKIVLSLLVTSAVSCPIAASAQDLYVSEYISGGGSNSITKVAPDGTLSTFVSGVSYPYGMTFDASGNLYEADYYGGGTIHKITPAGVRSTVASGLGTYIASIKFDTSGNLYAAAYSTNSIKKISSDGTVSTFASGLGNPFGLAFDASGNLFVAAPSSTYDRGANVKGSIYEITPGGVVSTFSTGSLNAFGLAFAPSVSASTPTSVPEPFTIVGTLIGGTAAMRMRKKLRAGSNDKN